MMVGPRRPTLLETGTRADGDSKSEFSAGTTREPLHKSTTPHPALRASLSRWERDGVVRAFSLWEKVPEGRMRGGTNVSCVRFMTCAELRPRESSGDAPRAWCALDRDLVLGSFSCLSSPSNLS